MLKGYGVKLYTLFKLLLYVYGAMIYIDSSRLQHRQGLMIGIAILIVNGFFRQLYLYEKENLRKYGTISIALDIVICYLMGRVGPFTVNSLLFTPTIFEAMAAHSLPFGIGASAAALGSMYAIHIMVRINAFSFYEILEDGFFSYGLGILLVAVISYMTSLQIRERVKIARSNQELEQAYKKLLDNASKVQQLSVEKERTRMAREIHDTLAHTLTAVVVQLEACKKLIDVDTARAKNEIEKAQTLTRDGLQDVKRTIKALRPQALENSSFIDAVLNLIQDIQQNTGVEVVLSRNIDHELVLQPSEEVALFRVLQESITNAIRHGEAKKVVIDLGEKDGELQMNIRDDGKGCSSIKEGFGLKGITERIRAIKGDVSFSSSANEGFQTHIAIPYGRGTVSGH